MLRTFFLVCAAGGGALVLVQALLSALAIGVHHGPHLHRHGGNRGWGHKGVRGPRVQAAHRLAGKVSPAVKGGGMAKVAPRAAGPVGRTAPAAARHAPPQGTHRNTSTLATDSLVLMWLHSMFNFQGLLAGATVMGLAGLAASAAGMATAASLGLAVGAGVVMLMLVAGILTAMVNMDADGTVQMERAVGAMGTVYLGIPANHSGLGKVTVTVQERMMELAAVTYEEQPLARGAAVVVVEILDNGVVEVVSGEKYLPDLVQTDV